jgi:predicted TIM-barrel enzyme
VDDLTAARSEPLPVLIGSGHSPQNAAELVPHADGFIVGTSMRSGRGAFDRVVQAQVEAMVRAIGAA